jgi:cytochrome subunit of sulfide dehydrogenase
MKLKRLNSQIAMYMLATTAIITPAAAFSQSKDELNVASLAATCAACHGTLGKAVNGSPVVSLAGLPKDYIVTQMAAFKAGTRPATVMHQLSKGYNEAQVAQIATYFASQKK